LLTLIFLLLLILLLRPRWRLSLTRQVDVSPAVGAVLVEKHDCRSRHVIGGEEAYIGPNI